MRKSFCLFVLIILFSFPLNSEEVFTYQTNPFQANKSRQGRLRTRYYPYYSADPQTLKTVINNHCPGLALDIDEQSRQIILSGELKNIKKAKAIIKKMTGAKRQIALEVKILEISQSGLQQIGILWSLSKEGFSFTTEGETRLEGLLKSLEGQGKARILATPRVTTVENKEAFIRIGDRVPYAIPAGNSLTDTNWQLKYLDAGIILKIKPVVSGTDNVLIEMQPEVVILKEWKPTAAGNFPILSSREVQTTILVKSGESVAIGGLRAEEKRENYTKIPILGDIPLLGGLFRYTSIENEQTEIIFIITPKILSS